LDFHHKKIFSGKEDDGSLSFIGLDYWATKDFEGREEKYGLVYLTGHGESDTKFLKA
jgi:hypothetical protein